MISVLWSRKPALDSQYSKEHSVLGDPLLADANRFRISRLCPVTIHSCKLPVLERHFEQPFNNSVPGIDFWELVSENHNSPKWNHAFEPRDTFSKGTSRDPE